jgi:hypothetical protein
MVRYDLTFQVTEASAHAVTLQDHLPAGLDPTTVAFVDGPIGTVSGNVLTWVLGTVTPGTLTLSFTVRVDPATEGESVLVNTARATSPSAAPTDASAQVKVKGDVQVTVGIYNDAGELVLVCSQANLSRAIDALEMTGEGYLSEVGQSVTFTWGGGRVLGSWDGLGQNGQPVANGTYFVKVDSVDAYGTTSSVTKSIAVSRRVVRVSVKVYNEVGEVVRRLYTEKPASDSDVRDVTLSTTVIHPGGDGKDGLETKVGIVLSNGLAMEWDGRGENGQNVQDGTYYLQVNVENLEEGTREITKCVSVLGSSPRTGLTGVWPNLVRRPAMTTTVHAASLGSGQSIRAKLYTLAGMLAGHLQGEEGRNDLRWDLSAYENGYYLVVIETREQGRLVDRTLKRLILLR